MQTQGQVEISNAMKNMFLHQVQKEPIARIEVPVKILQEGLMEVVEGAQVVLRNLHQAAVQAVLQAQAEALAHRVEVAVVHLLHQVAPHLENNLKNLL